MYSERKWVTYRFPHDDVVTECWCISTDNDLRSVGCPVKFLRTAVKSDRLVMQMPRHVESPIELAGAPVVTVRVAEDCPSESRVQPLPCLGA